jgi:hypothetical protein
MSADDFSESARSSAPRPVTQALVLLDRAGRPVPTTVAPEQRAAWAALRDQHAAVMPR